MKTLCNVYMYNYIAYNNDDNDRNIYVLNHVGRTIQRSDTNLQFKKS